MSDFTTVIGARTHISGQIEGDEDLQIFGRVDGSIDVSGSVVVEQEAVVEASISAGVVDVRGAVVGDVQAEELVHLGPEARMVGNIVAPRVAMEEGAQFSGLITAGAPAARPAEPKVASPPPGRTVAAPPPRPAPPEPRTPPRITAPPRRTVAPAPPRVAPRASEPVQPEPVLVPQPDEPEPRSRDNNEGNEESLSARDRGAGPAAGSKPPIKPPPKPPTTAGKKVRSRRK